MPDPAPTARRLPPQRWPATLRGPRSPRLRTTLTVLALALGWALVALPVAALVFVNSSRTTVLASHEAEVSPTLDGWARVDLGPLLPSVRYPSGGRIGANIELGKTSLTSYDALVRRYAFIAGQPEGQIAKVHSVIRGMALAAIGTGALCGLAVPGLWFLLGPRRRHELVHSRRALTVLAGVSATGLALVTVLVERPWDSEADALGVTSWQSVSAALPDVTIPREARPLEVDSGLLTQGTKRLVESAFDSYRKSSDFYRTAASEVPALAGRLHQPDQGETVGVLVSDRHDNVGMDPVARAIADAGGATFLLDAGDDTSTGSSWEAFSLESLDKAFEDFDDRFFVAGNHDHGSFITDQARHLGFTALEGEVVDGPDGIRLLGVDDPRSSGLGNWKDETGLSFEEVSQRIADTACDADAEGERVTTLLVHDANSGAPALERGCVDLVLAGHLHVIVGPTARASDDGQVGYSYTTGSTGGAAYAIAIGTKPRRDAVVSLVTYRSGVPVGVQWVSLSPLGRFTVGDYKPLDVERPSLGPAGSTESPSGSATKGAPRR